MSAGLLFSALSSLPAPLQLEPLAQGADGVSEARPCSLQEIGGLLGWCEPLPPLGHFSPCRKVDSGSDLRVRARGVWVLAAVSVCVRVGMCHPP